MRILRLVDRDGIAVEFHPFVTVVAGLSDDQRQALREAFAAAVTGRTAGLHGLIEVHEVVLDLDDRTLDLLDLDQVNADVVVEAADLPGAGSSDLARQLHGAERRLDLLEESRRDAQARVRAADEDVERLRRELEEARVAAEEHAADEEQDEEDPWSEHAEALETAEATAAELAAPAAGAAGAVARARRALDDAELRAKAVEEALSATAEEEAGLRQRRDELVARIDHDAESVLDAARAALAEFDEESERLAEHAAELEAARQAEEEAARRAEEEAARQAEEEAARRAEEEAARQAEEEAARQVEEENLAETGSDATAVADETGDPTDAPSDDAALDDSLDDPTASGSSVADRAADLDRQHELEVRLSELQAALALQDSFDSAPVRSAIDDVRNSRSSSGLVAPPEALGLADRLDSLDRRLESEPEVEPPSRADLDAARSAVDDAQERYRSLEEEVRGHDLSEADRADLEAAHAAVLDVQDELAERRLGRKRLEARLEQARSMEEVLLDRLGFRSYTDYLTGGAGSELTPADADALQQARIQVLEAEARLAELEQASAQASELAALARDRARLQGSARAMVGEDVPDDGLVEALVSLRVEAEAGDMSAPLVRAFEQVGLPVGGLGLSVEELLQMAADWLDEFQRGEEQRASLEEERTVVERELDDVHARLVAEELTPSSETDAGEPEPGTDASEVADRSGLPRFADDRAGAADTELESLFAMGDPAPAQDDAEGRSERSDSPADGPADGAGDDDVVDLARALTGHLGPTDEEPGLLESELVDGSVGDASEPETVEVHDPVASERAAVRAELVAAVEGAERRLAANDDLLDELSELDETIGRVQAGSPVAIEQSEIERLRSAVADAEETHRRIEADRVAAEAEVVRLRAIHRALAQADPSEETDGGDDAVGTSIDQLQVSLAEAEAGRSRAEDELESVRHDLDAAVAEVAGLRQAVVDAADDEVPVAEVEWYLLARLAAQREVSFAGSVPLVIDRALDQLDDDDVDHLLGRLERLAGAVQVVHLSDDPRLIGWAERAGEQRAALVRPVEVATVAS